MKLDKETVVKYQFWFLLGSYLVVWLVTVLWLMFTAKGPIEAKKKDYDGGTQSLKTASQNPVNESTFCPPWATYGETFNKHKRKIWGDAWELQKDMFDWPKELTDRHDMSTPQ